MCDLQNYYKGSIETVNFNFRTKENYYNIIFYLLLQRLRSNSQLFSNFHKSQLSRSPVRIIFFSPPIWNRFHLLFLTYLCFFDCNKWFSFIGNGNSMARVLAATRCLCVQLLSSSLLDCRNPSSSWQHPSMSSVTPSSYFPFLFYILHDHVITHNTG